MLKSALKKQRPIPSQHLWCLVQRILAQEGPMGTKEVYSSAKNVYGDKTGSLTFFKRNILGVMKKYGQVKTKSNEPEIREAARKAKEAEDIMLKEAKLAHQESQERLQATYGASFSKSSFRSSKKKAAQTKTALPTMKFRWYLLAKHQQVNEWKQAGLPTSAELDALAIEYNSKIPRAERPEAIKPPWQR
ncbi:hypothetical protein BDF19DRAFT_451983 [Syncephalis fuscata]|nr:hypothetical protein BDF19DRAFT_451983 [Syncephalis fuscata]